MGFLRELENPCVPSFERWEILKENVKMTAIERSSEVAFQARMKEKGLKDNLKHLCLLECDNSGVGAHDITMLNTITRLVHVTEKI